MKYQVIGESYRCRKAVVEANNVDEAEEKFRKGETVEEWEEVGVGEEEVISVESIIDGAVV